MLISRVLPRCGSYLAEYRNLFVAITSRLLVASNQQISVCSKDFYSIVIKIWLTHRLFVLIELFIPAIGLFLLGRNRWWYLSFTHQYRFPQLVWSIADTVLFHFHYHVCFKPPEARNKHHERVQLWECHHLPVSRCIWSPNTSLLCV